jgi:3D (Asp-Asp-Asp) domain-containing protein
MKLATLVAIALSLIFLSFTGETSHATAYAASPGAVNFDCSDGWRITGYYTPVETDFASTESREIDVRGVGKQTFDAEFLRATFDDEKGYGEGWGKTRFGWYLGNYNGGWHKADAPLDANDKPLEANTVAVDNSFVPRGSVVEIPGLPGDLGQEKFASNDVGVSVHGKHIDVYTGEGREARHRMYAVTFEEDDRGLTRVCFEPPAR